MILEIILISFGTVFLICLVSFILKNRLGGRGGYKNKGPRGGR